VSPLVSPTGTSRANRTDRLRDSSVVSDSMSGCVPRREDFDRLTTPPRRTSFPSWRVLGDQDQFAQPPSASARPRQDLLGRRDRWSPAKRPVWHRTAGRGSHPSADLDVGHGVADFGSRQIQKVKDRQHSRPKRTGVDGRDAVKLSPMPATRSTSGSAERVRCRSARPCNR